MAGDVFGAAVLNVEKLKAVTKQRREEIEWAVFEVELNQLVTRKAKKGGDKILLILGTTDIPNGGCSAFDSVDVTSVKQWMLKRSIMEGRLYKRGFTSVAFTTVLDEDFEGRWKEHTLELSWA
ncbi:unnamed protein product [Polarella glacialis]|uniref:Uncharacterized protein n=1 Tax=Polarella glacialis TaxID=89957 RepID=A0A813LBA9_POLGL|nr:unnamed protein product [Polarella glacialis]CAE8727866.1 unnamed protein product [Polarella glacialis]|mmetsp:Transcript_63127/g.102267  ORF Transcript_63127/g.102267 Transcript_63127/m.102267 type:complete len:123 (-) Transcript_63127:38-406(-)